MKLQCLILGHRVWNSFGGSKIGTKKGMESTQPNSVCHFCYECGGQSPFRREMYRPLSRELSAIKGD